MKSKCLWSALKIEQVQSICNIDGAKNNIVCCLINNKIFTIDLSNELIEST